MNPTETEQNTYLTTWRELLYLICMPKKLFYDNVTEFVILTLRAYILDKIANVTCFKYKYFSSGINYQAHVSYVSVWVYVVGFQ